jgi:hypothetical protein
MAEALGTVHTPWRGLLREWWWPVDPKLVFDQLAASVPEIMDGSLYTAPVLYKRLHILSAFYLHALFAVVIYKNVRYVKFNTKVWIYQLITYSHGFSRVSLRVRVSLIEEQCGRRTEIFWSSGRRLCW